MRRNFCSVLMNKSVPPVIPMHQAAALGWRKEVKSPEEATEM